MVMKKLREHTKIFLYIVVFAFVGMIIFEWGMDITGIKQRPNLMGEINGEEILYDRYYQAVRNQIETRRQQGNGELSDIDLTQIEDQVWESMVQEILMRQEINRRGIVATDSEVVVILKNNPPDILRSNKSFQTDGVFDLTKYKSALRDPANDWRPVEDYVRSFLPFEKLQQQIAAAVIATPEEVRWEYLKQNEKVKVNYIFFDPNMISDDEITLSETAVEQYYQENKENYSEPEKRKIDYVIFPIVPTPYDSQAVMDDALDLIEQLKEGGDFAELADAYSEDPGSKKRGGDLGFFGKGAMVKPFEEAAFSADTGDIVGPVRSSFGLHVIKVAEKKVEDDEEKVKASHILLKYTASNQTRGDISTKASLFAMDALEIGFAETAQKDSLKIESSPLFVNGVSIPGIGIARNFNLWTFSGNLGDLKEEPFDTDRGYIIAKISGIQGKRIKPLEEVQILIRNILIRAEKKKLTGRVAAEIRSKMLLSSDFKDIADRDSLELKETNLVTRNDFIPQVGKEPAFIGTAFRLQPKEISQPVETTRGYYLIQTIETIPINEAEYEKMKNFLSQQILINKKQQAFIEWYNNLKNNAEIEDKRQRNI